MEQNTAVKRTFSKSTKITLASIIALLSALLIGVLVFISFFIFASNAEKRSFDNQAAALEVIRIAKSYNDKNAIGSDEMYPTFTQLTSRNSSNSLSLSNHTQEIIINGQASDVTEDNPLAYEGCAEGFRVHFWDTAQKSVQSRTTGHPENC